MAIHLEVVRLNPDGAPRPTPLLFVHGAWHAAWCWENFLPYFAGLGYETHALSLRGHGKSGGRDRLRWTSVSDCVNDVAAVTAKLPAPPVLIGHSLGGYIVQKYLEAHTAPAAVLMASVPPRGILGFGIRYARRRPWQFLKVHATLSPRHYLDTPEIAHEFLFSPKLSREALERHYCRLQDESFRIELDTLALDLPCPEKVKTPLLVLGAALDAVFTEDEVHATARAYGTTAEIFPDIAHNMMLDPKWERVARRIAAWLSERGI